MYKIYRRKNGELLACFSSRKEAVFYCKVNQTLPTPDYEWEDEFEIQEQNNV